MQTENKIERYKNDIKDLPLWLKYVLAIFTVVGVIGTVFGTWVGYNMFISDTPIQVVTASKENNTENKTDISALFSKALMLETILERQNFLTKYIGDSIYGEGVIEEVSKYGDKFLIDIEISRQTVTCPQDGGEEKEKQILLWKEKKVHFSGNFTYQEYFNHKGLIIENCVLQTI